MLGRPIAVNDPLRSNPRLSCLYERPTTRCPNPAKDARLLRLPVPSLGFHTVQGHTTGHRRGTMQKPRLVSGFGGERQLPPPTNRGSQHDSQRCHFKNQYPIPFDLSTPHITCIYASCSRTSPLLVQKPEFFPFRSSNPSSGR